MSDALENAELEPGMSTQAGVIDGAVDGVSEILSSVAVRIAEMGDYSDFRDEGHDDSTEGESGTDD